MERRATVIKHLRMMSYTVHENNDGSVYVMIKTKGGYGCRISLYLEDFENEFVIEETVHAINSFIMKDL